MKKIRGFTLIEVMIVLVVIGILAAIAVPAYTNQLIRGTRSSAQAAMMDLANRQLFYLQTNRTYAVTATDLGVAALPSEVTSFYTLTITMDMTATPPTFLITMTPIAGTRQASDGAITLDSTGAKGCPTAPCTLNKW
jgi:type IV pilus assembly protein PilE